MSAKPKTPQGRKSFRVTMALALNFRKNVMSYDICAGSHTAFTVGHGCQGATDANAATARLHRLLLRYR